MPWANHVKVVGLAKDDSAGRIVEELEVGVDVLGWYVVSEVRISVCLELDQVVGRSLVARHVELYAVALKAKCTAIS